MAKTSFLYPVSGPSLLPSLSKLLYQLCEASAKCEVEGIRSDGALRPTAFLLERLLGLLQRVAETNPENFSKVCACAHAHTRARVCVCVCMYVCMSARVVHMYCV